MTVTRQPNPGDWCTSTYVEQLLGVHRQTIHRMAKTGILTRYHVSGSGAALFWLPEVHEVAAARQRSGLTHQT